MCVCEYFRVCLVCVGICVSWELGECEENQALTAALKQLAQMYENKLIYGCEERW